MARPEFDPLEQAAAFLRKISFYLAADSDDDELDMLALSALDHAERVQAEVERQRAEQRALTITPGRCLIDTHRCVTHDGRHILADGSVE